MEGEKRKRVDEGQVKGKREKAEGEDDGCGKMVVPADEEVDEFFAILKRIQVAVKYFQQRKRNSRELTAKPWNPSFEREDFEEAKKEWEGNHNPGLDLNSDPVRDKDQGGSDLTVETRLLK